ncbi:hypothetical protein OGZ02_13490 [Brachyspira hyodysenteriae]|nr:hypothetical protein [Brachyspira hyodysenteriae]MDA1469817.1 hypothetical protein [Brachyspira hyodysenteriae]
MTKSNFKYIIKWAKENDAYDIANTKIEDFDNIKELNLSNLDITDIPLEFLKLKI